MWLIDTTTLELVQHHTCPTGRYAILSHTWDEVAQELEFEEFKFGRGREKTGFEKIRKCCEQAREDDLDLAWVDTCCIDKRSSSELSEAINSMFAWYASASVCYVYLGDVLELDYAPNRTTADESQSLTQSRWFTRGWTLQELIAPSTVRFYTRYWDPLGDKSQLAATLQDVTGIPIEVLTSSKSFLDCSVGQRMSWAARRRTTRLEDAAYCLIGLFSVNIPLLYGEGERAFLRLQETIIQQTDDETIFAWTGIGEGGSGLLAPNATHFAECGDVIQAKRTQGRPPFQKTNRGISIELKMIPYDMNIYMTPLQCQRSSQISTTSHLGIFMCRTSEDFQYRRVSYNGNCLGHSTGWETSRAKTVAAFVPDDGRNIELAPHGTLTSISIESTLTAWQLVEGSLSDPGSLMVETLGLASSKSQQHTLSHEHYLLDRHRLSTRAVRQVKKLDFINPQNDFEHGYVLVFGESYDSQQTLRYRVQIGFDKEFRPVCIVYTKPFRIMSVSPEILRDRVQWLLFKSDIHSLTYTMFPSWNHRTTLLRRLALVPHCLVGILRRLVKGLRALAASLGDIVYITSGIAIFPHLYAWRWAVLPLVASISSEENVKTTLNLPAKSQNILHVEQVQHFLSNLTDTVYQVFPALIKSIVIPFTDSRDSVHLTGDRITGLDICINDRLSREYSCLEVRLSLRRVEGTQWVLSFREERRHVQVRQFGVYCGSCRRSLNYKLVVAWVPFILRSAIFIFLVIVNLRSLIVSPNLGSMSSSTRSSRFGKGRRNKDW